MKAIKVLYYSGLSNFGDVLNQNVCEYLGVSCIESGPIDCDATMIGSTLYRMVVPDARFLSKSTIKFLRDYLKAYLKPPVEIWGTGFLDEPGQNVLANFLLRRANVHAVRGEYTKARLERMLNVTLGNIPLADPGLLAPKLFDYKISKNYKLGIIPHFREKNDSRWLSIVREIPGSKIIDVQSPVMDALYQIAECEAILSSSLHGLVVADSFGIPNQRVIADQTDYKYKDYYSSFQVNPQPFHLSGRVFSSDDLRLLKSSYSITPEAVKEKQEQLLETFPFH